MHRSTVRITGDAVGQRLGQHRLQRGQGRLPHLLPYGVVIVIEQPAGVCRPKIVSVWKPCSRSAGATIDGSVSEWQ